jgi:hypothetical protein
MKTEVIQKKTKTKQTKKKKNKQTNKQTRSLPMIPQMR